MENGVEERKWQTDKGYAWVVLAAASLTALLRAGQASVMGIYLVLFYQAYPDSTTLLSSIIAMSAFTSAALGPLVTMSFEVYGGRIFTMLAAIILALSYIIVSFFPSLATIYIFYGILPGACCLVMSVTAMCQLQVYFVKRRGLALGVFTTFSGLGVMLFPLLSNWLIEIYTWRKALLVEAAIFLHFCVTGALFRPSPQQMKRKKTMSSAMRSMCRSLTCHSGHDTVPRHLMLIFYIQITGCALTFLGYNAVVGFSVMRAVSYGLTRTQGSILISVIGCIAPIRLLFGWLSDKPWCSRLVLMAISATTAGTANILSTLHPNIYYLLGCQVLTSIGTSAVIACSLASALDIVGTEHGHLITGLHTLILGFSKIILNIAGPLIKFCDSVNAVFLVFGIGQVLGGAIIFTAYICLKKAARLKQQQPLNTSPDVEVK